MKHCLACVMLSFLTVTAFAQQHPLYSLYTFNGLVINPAYAGSREALSATLTARTQWTGLDRAPMTQVLGVHAPTWDDQHGFSLLAVHDRAGFTSNLAVAAGYAYRIRLNEHARLAFGLNLGMNQYQVRLSQVETWQPNDVAFNGGDYSRWHAIAGAGVYLHSRSFFAGFSSPNLIPNKVYDKYYEPLLSRASRHYFFTTGVVMKLGDNVKMKPSILVRAVKGAPIGTDLNLSFIFRDAVSAGISYRPGNAMVLLTEIHLSRTLRMGYAFDADLGPLRTWTGGSHELMLGIDWGMTKDNVETPRRFF